MDRRSSFDLVAITTPPFISVGFPKNVGILLIERSYYGKKTGESW